MPDKIVLFYDESLQTMNEPSESYRAKMRKTKNKVDAWPLENGRVANEKSGRVHIEDRRYPKAGIFANLSRIVLSRTYEPVEGSYVATSTRTHGQAARLHPVTMTQ